MKKVLLLSTIIVLSLSVTACTYWSNPGKENSFFNGNMDESVSYDKDLSSYERIELNIDLTVSSVDIAATNGDTLKYDQKANKEELLASFDYDEKGDTLVVTFKNEKNPNFISGSQKSEVVILIPEGIEVVFSSNLDVGDITFDLDNIEVVEIDASTNVGEINIDANKNQEKLVYINITSDVGEMNADLNGKMEALETIKANTNTGEVNLKLNGELSSALEVDAKTDVGDITLEFNGKYEDVVNCKASSSVGSVTLAIPKNHETVMEAHMTEFTSKLEISEIPFTKSKSIYKIAGDESAFNIDLTVSIGDATVKYSN